MKKIVSRLVVIFLFLNMFVFNADFNNVYKELNKIFLKYENKLSTCSKKKQFYINLINKVNKISNSWKYKKYRRLLKIIKIVANHRLKNINCVDYKPSVYLWKGDRLLYNQFDYTWLVNDIINYSWIVLKKFFIPVKIEGVKVIRRLTSDFHLLINNKRYQYNGKKIYYYNCYNKKFLKKCIKSIREKEGLKKFLWVVYKDKVPYVYVFSSDRFVTVPFDFSKPLEAQFKFINKKWGVYIDKFLFVQKTIKNNKIYWLVDINWELFITVWPWTIRFYIYNANKKNFRFPLENSNLIIIKQTWDSYYIFTGGLKFYYIGDKKFFSNRLRFNLLWKLLFSSYLKLSSLQKDYNKNDIVLLLNLAKKYNWRRILELYKFIIQKYKYDPYLYDIAIKYHYTQEELENLLKEKKELLENWIIFDVLRHKKWVCQSFTEILSLIAILNWIEADVLKWYPKWSSLLHQVSVIWNLYYDPTYDLWNKYIKYFGMTKKKLLKYFKILKNEKVF